MSKRRASMREGPLADLFRQTDGVGGDDAEAADRRRGRGAAPRRRRCPSPPPRQPRRAAPRPSRSRRGPRSPPSARRPAPEPDEPPRLRAVPDPGDPGEAGDGSAAAPGSLRARGEASAYLASIRVVGVGGGGLNALQRMIDADIHGVEFVAINTDAQQLAMSDANVKLQIGRELTSGLGSGADSATRPQGRRGLDRPAAPGAARIRPRVRDRGRGRRHRHRRRARDRQGRARARRAHRRHRHDAVRIRGQAPQRGRADGPRGAAGAASTRSSSSPTTACSRCSSAASRWSTRSAWPTTCCARACRASAT